MDSSAVSNVSDILNFDHIYLLIMCGMFCT